MKTKATNTEISIGQDYLQLRVPEKKKTKDWYWYQSKRLIPGVGNFKVGDYEELDRLYKFMNNDFSGFAKEIDYYCGTMLEVGETEETLVPYNPIPEKFNVLEGRLLAQPVAHSRPMLQTAKAMNIKTDQFRQEIRASVEEQLLLSKLEVTLQNQGLPEDEIAKRIEQERSRLLPQNINKKNYQAQGEITFSKLLANEIIRQDVKTKKLDTLRDLLIGSRFVTYAGWKYGKPYNCAMNPLYIGFLKDEDEPRLEKGDFVFFMDKITVGTLLQEYGNTLSNDDLEALLGDSPWGHASKDTMKRPLFDEIRYQSIVAMVGAEEFGDRGRNENNSLFNDSLLRETERVHCEFKAFRQVVFLSYVDEWGQKVTEKLSAEADVIPEDAAKIEFTNRFFQKSYKWVWVDEISGIEYEAEILYIPRRYEFTLLDGCILVDYREVPLQPDYNEDPFGDFELSYKGLFLNNRNANWISPLMRSLPYAFQKMSVKRLMDKELAKYEGKVSTYDLDQIPTNIGQNNTEMSSTEDAVLRAKVIARRTGSYFYSGSNTKSGALPSNTRSTGIQHQVLDTSMQIMNLQQVSNLIDVETGLALGIPPQSQAIVTPGTNASDNRQALVQHTLATQILFYCLEQVWNRTMEEHMRNTITYIEMNIDDLGLSMESILPDESKEFFKILPEDVEFMRDIGLVLQSNGKEQMYFDMMMQQVFSIGQNGGEGAEQISAILKALTTSGSPEEVHDMITKVSAEQQARMAEMQQREAELQKQTADRLMEVEKFRSELKLESDLQKIKEQGNQAARAADIQADTLRRQFDVDKDGKNDQIQRDREERDFEATENEKDRKLDLQLAKMKNASTTSPK